jgi:16S rRNA (cytidine1402-2'-O)-methyltransferase
LIRDVLECCKEETRFCIAVDITAASESIRTQSVKRWKAGVPDIHKRLAMFLLHASV